MKKILIASLLACCFGTTFAGTCISAYGNTECTDDYGNMTQTDQFGNVTYKPRGGNSANANRDPYDLADHTPRKSDAQIKADLLKSAKESEEALSRLNAPQTKPPAKKTALKSTKHKN